MSFLDWLGLLPFKTFIACAELSPQINESLCSSWYTSDQLQHMRLRRDAWRKLAFDCRAGRPIVSPKCWLSLRGQLLQQSTYDRSHQQKQFRTGLSMLNDPLQWDAWESQCQYYDLLKQLQEQWLSFSDVGGVHVKKSVVMVQALQSMDHFLQRWLLSSRFMQPILEWCLGLSFVSYLRVLSAQVIAMQRQFEQYFRFVSIELAHRQQCHAFPATMMMHQLSQLGLMSVDEIPESEVMRNDYELFKSIHHALLSTPHSSWVSSMYQELQFGDIGRSGGEVAGEWWWLPRSIINMMSSWPAGAVDRHRSWISKCEQYYFSLTDACPDGFGVMVLNEEERFTPPISLRRLRALCEFASDDCMRHSARLLSGCLPAWKRRNEFHQLISVWVEQQVILNAQQASEFITDCCSAAHHVACHAQFIDECDQWSSRLSALMDLMKPLAVIDRLRSLSEFFHAFNLLRYHQSLLRYRVIMIRLVDGLAISDDDAAFLQKSLAVLLSPFDDFWVAQQCYLHQHKLDILTHFLTVSEVYLMTEFAMGQRLMHPSARPVSFNILFCLTQFTGGASANQVLILSSEAVLLGNLTSFLLSCEQSPVMAVPHFNEHISGVLLRPVAGHDHDSLWRYLRDGSTHHDAQLAGFRAKWILKVLLIQWLPLLWKHVEQECCQESVELRLPQNACSKGGDMSGIESQWNVSRADAHRFFTSTQQSERDNTRWLVQALNKLQHVVSILSRLDVCSPLIDFIVQIVCVDSILLRMLPYCNEPKESHAITY